MARNIYYQVCVGHEWFSDRSSCSDGIVALFGRVKRYFVRLPLNEGTWKWIVGMANHLCPAYDTYAYYI